MVPGQDKYCLFLPEVNLALDQPSPDHSQLSTHHMRIRIGEGQQSSLLLVRNDVVFI